jgi:hypothetical protein
VKSRHRKTLGAIFARPALSSIAFADIESLITGLGGAVREGAGSRVAFELRDGARLYLHRPHPGKEAKKYQVEAVREWLESKGITP